jgi:hypothetical protein
MNYTNAAPDAACFMTRTSELRWAVTHVTVALLIVQLGYVLELLHCPWFAFAHGCVAGMHLWVAHQTFRRARTLL